MMRKAKQNPNKILEYIFHEDPFSRKHCRKINNHVHFISIRASCSLVVRICYYNRLATNGQLGPNHIGCTKCWSLFLTHSYYYILCVLKLILPVKKGLEDVWWPVHIYQNDKRCSIFIILTKFFWRVDKIAKFHPNIQGKSYNLLSNALPVNLFVLIKTRPFSNAQTWILYPQCSSLSLNRVHEGQVERALYSLNLIVILLTAKRIVVGATCKRKNRKIRSI